MLHRNLGQQKSQLSGVVVEPGKSAFHNRRTTTESAISLPMATRSGVVHQAASDNHLQRANSSALMFSQSARRARAFTMPTRSTTSVV